jgi:hypothetical protein
MYIYTERFFCVTRSNSVCTLCSTLIGYPSFEQLEVVAQPLKNAAKPNPKAAHIDGTYVFCLLFGDKYCDSIVLNDDDSFSY